MTTNQDRVLPDNAVCGTYSASFINNLDNGYCFPTVNETEVGSFRTTTP
jgi:hypothetical protein